MSHSIAKNDFKPSPLLKKLVPHALFSRLTIAKKMLLGYAVLVVLTIMVVVHALVNLQRLNRLNEDIITIDITVREASDKMLDAILAQDTYEKRYLILNSKDMRALFRKRGDEFRSWIESLKKLPETSDLPLDEIEGLHKKYMETFAREVRLVQEGNSDQAREISNGALKKIMDHLTDRIRTMALNAKKSQEKKMQLIGSIGPRAFMTTVMLFVVSIVVGAVAGLVITHHIASSIHKLKVATERIAEGKFDYDPEIRASDEIGGLAHAFLAMGRRLKQLEEMYLDASPLTRLPGGIAIENVLKKRLAADQLMAFCVVDLDNFKAFNDRYGYAHGSEVIKETARIIEEAVKAKGGPDDFIGHVGGDDFVIITTPDRMRDVCNEIIAKFDERIPQFYSPEDRQRGYIRGKTRQGVPMNFPLMTISIAIVTNERRKLKDPLEASEIATELKDYAKTIPKSVFVVDQRRSV